MATHISFCDDDEYADREYCGTQSGEASRHTNDWRDVTCRRCLRARQKIAATFEAMEADIIRQMAGIAAMAGGE